MDRDARRKPLVVFLLLAPVAWLFLHPHRKSGKPATAAVVTQLTLAPSTMLWAWEVPEDLSTLDPTRAGVAFLSRELLLSNNPAQPVLVRGRHQPLRVAPGVFLMAVTRIETAPGFKPAPATAAQVARAIAATSAQPDIRALQVDFDATPTQQAFYADVLRQLRTLLPARLSLSITALVGWCSPASTSALNSASNSVDEAVPMFFRMGGPAATRASAPRSLAAIDQPLCSSSVGLSTDEAWPQVPPGRRVYLFRPGPWTPNDLALVNRFGYEGLKPHL